MRHRVTQSDVPEQQPFARLFLLFAVVLVGFMIVLSILEKVGIPNSTLGFLFVGFTLLIFIGIGLYCRTMQVDDFYVAKRQIPALHNGMATAADWISGAVFMTMTGTLFLQGHDGLALVIGWTGGFVLMATLVAPYLRKSGAYTVPDFLAIRFGGLLIRAMGLVILLAASFLFLLAQVKGSGLIVERFLGLSQETGVIVILACILLCSLLGGMRAVTWTQVAQFIVLFIAFLIPAAIISFEIAGIPTPQIVYGDILQKISSLEQTMLTNDAASGGLENAYLTPFANLDRMNSIALIICLMAGTASLPHILAHTLTTRSVRETRTSMNWSLVFIAILFITAPAYAAFAKLGIYEDVIGQTFTDLPEWVHVWGQYGGVTICGEAASSFAAISSACQSTGTDIVRLSDFSIDRDAIILASPEIAGLPFIMTGLMGAGALAALLSTASGLLLTMANGLSHDLYFKILDKNAPTGRRLFLARVLLVALASGCAFAATQTSPDPLKLVAWAFSITAAGIFPALVLSIWWDRCTRLGAIAGMLTGFAVTLAYLIYTEPAPFGYGQPTVFGIDNLSAGLFGMPLGVLVMIGVSLLKPTSSTEDRMRLREMRRPRGKVVHS